jgi:hypothetical protein
MLGAASAPRSHPCGSETQLGIIMLLAFDAISLSSKISRLFDIPFLFPGFGVGRRPWRSRSREYVLEDCFCRYDVLKHP